MAELEEGDIRVEITPRDEMIVKNGGTSVGDCPLPKITNQSDD